MIPSLQLAGPIKVESRAREVNTLIRSMSGMKEVIRDVSKFVSKVLVKELLQSKGSMEVGGATRRVHVRGEDVLVHVIDPDCRPR